jgi:hypothetical protein
MGAIIYTLCTMTSLLCSVLLLRSYSKSKHRLLFWAGICFVGITLNNMLLVADKIIFPTSMDLLTLRLLVALIALVFLLYGLIFDE